ncbi:MAG: hypothetical protein R2689_15115 [Microthrixaceae bacterium]
MAVTDANRLAMHKDLTAALGEESANTLMEHLPTKGAAELATKTDLDNLRTELDARFDKIDARFDKIDARFDKTDARFDKTDARFDKIDAAMATGFAKQLRWVVGTMVAMQAGTIATVGLILAYTR